MGVQRFQNNPTTTLAANTPASGAGSTVIAVASAALFPSSLTNGDWFVVTLQVLVAGLVTTQEIVKVTGVAGVNWTVVRAQEGTAALPWVTGNTVALLITAGGLGQFIQSGNLYPITAAESAAGLTVVNCTIAPYPLNVLRYGLVPNSSGSATANTSILRQLVSYKLSPTGLTGRLLFPNTTGADAYWFNDFIDFREGFAVDLCNCTWQFSKAAPSGNENNSGAVMAIRDFVLENGTINFDFASATGTGCTALFLGARGVEGSFYNPFYDAVYLAATGRTLGNITIRNIAITSNAPGQRCISLLGGVQDALFENVEVNPQGVGDGFYAEYGFATDGGGVATARQSSHGNNIRFVNFKATNLFSTGVGIGYNGAYNVVIDGLRVTGAATACGFGFGEAYYYNPWSGQDGSGSTKRTVTIRNVVAKNLSGSGIIIQGANASSVAIGYLSSVINALSTPALYVAQSDLVSATIDDFVLNGTSAGNGVQVIGADRIDISNGRIVGFNIGINATAEVTRYGIKGVEIFNCTGIEGVGIMIGDGFAVWSPTRLSVGEISQCFIAGCASDAIILAFTNSCKIVANRFGYLLAHDGIAETTQDSAVSAAATAMGVICDSNYVAAVTAGAAYALAGTASGGSTVINASGVVTTSGLWESALDSVSPDRGDVSFTYVPHADFTTQLFGTPLTANRTMALSTTTALAGDEVTTIRTAAATGAFTLIVNGTKTLAAGTWVTHQFNSTAWIEKMAGSL